MVYLSCFNFDGNSPGVLANLANINNNDNNSYELRDIVCVVISSFARSQMFRISG